jgi:preprotein translocase subunit SecD
VAEDQTALLPDEMPAGLLRRTERLGLTTGEVLEGPSEASLQPLLSRLAPADRARTALECHEELDESAGRLRPRCCARLLEPAAVDSRSLTTAEVVWTDERMPPAVNVQLDGEGARRFEQLTAASLQRRLAIVVDGRILSAPIIQSRIAGGRAMIMLGGQLDPRALEREVNALAATLASGALAATWEIESVSARP